MKNEKMDKFKLEDEALDEVSGGITAPASFTVSTLEFKGGSVMADELPAKGIFGGKVSTLESKFGNRKKKTGGTNDGIVTSVDKKKGGQSHGGGTYSI